MRQLATNSQGETSVYVEATEGKGDTALVAAFLGANQGKSDEAIGALIGHSRSIVGVWRSQLKEEKRIHLKSNETREKIRAYLFSGSGTNAGLSVRDGVRAALAEIRAKLDEIESRLGSD